MHSDSARREIGAGMRRKRVAFASISRFMRGGRGARRFAGDQAATIDEADLAAFRLGAGRTEASWFAGLGSPVAQLQAVI
jgi:hypothetical protein